MAMQMPNNRQIRQFLAVAIVAAVVLLVGKVAVKNFTLDAPDNPSVKNSPGIDMAMNKLRFSEMKNDSKLWELVADKADYDKEPGIVQLSALRLETFEQKTGGVVVTSKNGNYFEPDRLVKMRDQVHAVTKRGMILDTEYLEYRPVTGIIQTDKPVSVLDGRLSLKANGMELFLKEETVVFMGQVDATIEGKK